MQEKYVGRACEPRICIMWTSSSSLHVAILVSQVVPVFVTPRGAVFSVSTLRQKRSSCPSMAGPWVSLWIRHVWRVSRGISGTSSSASMFTIKNSQGHSVGLVNGAAPIVGLMSTWSASRTPPCASGSTGRTDTATLASTRLPRILPRTSPARRPAHSANWRVAQDRNGP